MSEIRKIKVDCNEIEVILESAGKKDETCTIREMTGSDSDAYMQSIQDKLEFETDSDGKFTVKSIKSFDGLYSSLLVRTLYHENGELFTKDEVGKLSASAQRELFDAAQSLNAITESKKEQAKND